MIKLELKTNIKKLIVFILFAIISFALVNDYPCIPYTLMGIMFSSFLGSSILTKETDNKTIEFLYSKPLSKNNITLYKIISSIIQILMFLTITMVFNFLFLKINSNLNLKSFLIFACKEALMMAFTFTLSLFVSSFYNKTNDALTSSIFLIVLEYIIMELSKIYSFFKYLTYFSFYNHISLISLIICFILILIMLVLTFLNFNRKEFK